MKKMMIAMMAMLTIAAKTSAMSYEQARNEALFLTDKMAYELNLTNEQYEAAYEINLDYLMGVTSYDDVYGTYWEHRNLDLSYILLDWQWNAFCAATYFYRPLYWSAGYWHFGIYARYPHRDYFYFGRPAFYATYRGGHSWRMNGGASFYHGHRDHFRPAPGHAHVGMRDGWHGGDHRGGGVREGRSSSTRTTVGRGHGYPSGQGTGHGNGYNRRDNRTTTPQQGQPSTGSRGNRPYGGTHGTVTTPQRQTTIPSTGTNRGGTYRGGTTGGRTVSPTIGSGRSGIGTAPRSSAAPSRSGSGASQSGGRNFGGSRSR